ncbi:MAG: polysaccharide deacetylase family protein [Chthonomonadales bacterium]
MPAAVPPLPRVAIPAAATVCLTILIALAGCHQQHPKVAALPAKPAEPARLSDAELKSYHANEAGAVMIVMYHHFDPNRPDSDLNRRPDTFRKDLEAFYKRGYRPVTLSEFLSGKMDVPGGKTPIVLTFDDASPTQFKVITGSDGKPSIAPDCAVGILETFHKTHPDWPTKGTFFVLPKEGRNQEPFGQADSVADKFAYLLKNGYEIQNHTSTHSSMRGMTAERVQWELATAVRDARAINPNAQMDILALPYGQVPRKDARRYLLDGEQGGTHYHNTAIIKAAWRPVLSPITRNSRKITDGGSLCPFDPYNIERITPDGGKSYRVGTLEYWIKFFDEHPNLRYYSDGSPTIAAVPRAYQSWVDPARARKCGVTLQFYPQSTSAPASEGNLSVRP